MFFELRRDRLRNDEDEYRNWAVCYLCDNTPSRNTAYLSKSTSWTARTKSRHVAGLRRDPMRRPATVAEDYENRQAVAVAQVNTASPRGSLPLELGDPNAASGG